MNMTDFTSNWHWPQWAFAAILSLRFAMAATMHGKEKLQASGKPERYNAFAVLSNTVTWTLILVAGGFFA